jgi:Flp pilus assembly protein TadB
VGVTTSGVCVWLVVVVVVVVVAAFGVVVAGAAIILLLVRDNHKGSDDYRMGQAQTRAARLATAR